MQSNKKYITINNEMTFPNPNNSDLEELMWRLVYDPECFNPTKTERILLRDFISAYISILTHPTRNLENTKNLIRDIRKKLNEE